MVYKLKFESNNNVILIAATALLVSYVVGVLIMVVQRWRGCRVRQQTTLSEQMILNDLQCVLREAIMGGTFPNPTP